MGAYLADVVFIIEWIIRLVMLPVIVLRKEWPATCLAWLTIIFFEPTVGLVLYLMIGENRLGRRRLARRRRQRETFDRTVSHSRAGSEHHVDPQQAGHLLIHLTEEQGGLPLVGGNRLEFIPDTDRVVDRLVADIDAAAQHVHLLFYIYHDDVVGRRVGEALIRASRRGVACRVLVDDVGSRRMLRRYAPRLRKEGVEVVSLLRASLWRIVFKRLDLRNHRKIAVIDGCAAYTGSQNISEATYGQRRVGVWRDIMARITGPAVLQLQEIFLEDWFHETQSLLDDASLMPPSPAAGSVTLQVVPSGPDLPTDQLLDLVVRAIFLAERRVVITSPYFVPNEEMLMALRLAVQRGVRVDIVVPQWTDHWLVDAAGRFYLYYLLRHGVHVYFHERGLLHSKTLTIDDDLGMFGSANFDIRSFRLNFELNLLLHSAEAIADLHALQAHYLAESHAAALDDPAVAGFGPRLTMNLAKLASPLL